MITLKKSKSGLIAASAFLLPAVGIWGWLIYSASTNHADSGEGGILLIPFALPWLYMLPADQNTLWLFPVYIFLNAFLIYCLLGGLRWKNIP